MKHFMLIWFFGVSSTAFAVDSPELVATPGHPVCVKKTGTEDVDALSALKIVSEGHFKYDHNPYQLEAAGMGDGTSTYSIEKVRKTLEVLGRPAKISLALTQAENVIEVVVEYIIAANEAQNSVTIKAGPDMEAFYCSRYRPRQEDLDKRGIVNADREIDKLTHGAVH